MKINYLTKDDYFIKAKQLQGGHWTPDTMNGRWLYHDLAIELIKELNVKSENSIIEMGTMGISCVMGSDTIDYMERWDYPGKQPTYTHDARTIPWPIKDKEYEIFIALRVFQHLYPFQQECFKEAMRIAKNIILVVPANYQNPLLPNAKGINYEEFVNYMEGVHPNYFYEIPIVQESHLYYWDLEAPSNVNIKNSNVGIRKYKKQLRNKYYHRMIAKSISSLLKPNIS